MRPPTTCLRSSLLTPSTKAQFSRTPRSLLRSSDVSSSPACTRSMMTRNVPSSSRSTLLQCQSRPSLRSNPAAMPKSAVAFYRAVDQPPREWRPPTDTAGVQAYLSDLFPNLEFPEKLAQRMVTHSSWKGGIEGHNTRLAFLGRRTLHAYLLLFLNSAIGRGANSSNLATTSDETPLEYLECAGVAERALGGYSLGDHVGRTWQVGQVMRWVSATPGGEKVLPANEGFETVGGTTVEAIMGGIMHQFGGNVAHRVFHTRVLPYLKPTLPQTLHAYIDEICMSMGGPRAVLFDDGASLQRHGSSIPPAVQEVPKVPMEASHA